MRTIILIFTFLLFDGCGEPTTKKEILEFEKELGQEEAIGLSKMVEHFENELLKRYPNKTLDQAYEIHLDFIANWGGLQIDQWIPAQLRKDSIFESYSSKLLNEIWIKPDTVWIKDERIFRSYRGTLNPSGHRIYAQIYDFDSLIYHERNLEIFNNQGSYLRAFQKISNTNKIAEWYYFLKREAANIHPAVMAEALNDHKLDYYNYKEIIKYSDYLVKRIILVETYTETCSNNG